jgi:hypothetical protein
MRSLLDVEEPPTGATLHDPNAVPFDDHVSRDRVEAVQRVGGDRRLHDDKFTRAQASRPISQSHWE